MSNGETRTRKASELLIQVSAWTGGIIAAAVGGFLIAFGSRDTAPSVLHYFKWAVIPLVIALAATWYIQIHSALHERDLEIPEAERTENDKKRIANRPGNIRFSTGIQVLFQTAAMFAIAGGVFFYKGPAPDTWSLIGSESTSEHTSYLLKVQTPDENGRKQPLLRILASDSSSGWFLCTIDPHGEALQDTGCPAGQGQAANTPALQLAGEISFHPARHSLRYEHGTAHIDLSEAVCNAKRALLDSRAGGAIVVGSHDRQPLLAGAKVATNESLARLRAEAVSRYLSVDNECGHRIETVISINAAPLHAEGVTAAPKELATDRTVKVYALVSSSRHP